MFPPKLRQRRVQSGPVLPHYKVLQLPDPANEPDSGFRRRRRHKESKIRLMITCILFSCLCSIGLFILVKRSSYDKKFRPHEIMLHHLRDKRRYDNKYKAKVFNYETVECNDGSKGYLNDNYCDCPDGSDEPRTSACSNILLQKQVFECLDKSMVIYSSRVGDGIRDCIDGSDEIQ